MPPQGEVSDNQTSEQNPGRSVEMIPVVGQKVGYSNSAFVHDQNDNAVKDNKDDDKKTVEDSFEFDDLLPHIGSFGVYQQMLFLLMIPFAFFVAWVYFTQIFVTVIPEGHWCKVPELGNLTQKQRVTLAIPQGTYGLEKCRMYAVNFTEILSQGIRSPDPSWPTKPCDKGWEYNFTTDDVPYASIAAELDWVCEQAALPTIAQAIFFCGAILGGLVFGWLADSKGRIPALVGANMVGFVAGVGTAFCNSFWTFCVCRFLIGMAFDNCFTMMYILVLEYVGPNWRTFVANMSIAVFFTFAASILPWIAWYLGDWRWLCVATSTPLVLAIFTPLLVPESARWLASQGKVDQALVILKKFEKMNGAKVDDKIYNEFKESCWRALKEEESCKTYSVLDLFKTPHLRKVTILMVVIWMAISLVFDGHVRNVGSLGLNIFTTFTVATVTEFPADTFLTVVLDRWGRRWLAFGSMALSGVFSLLAAVVPLGITKLYYYIINNDANCDICQKWKAHKEKAINARKEYQEDAEKPKATDELIISADLQKVIMLPRLEMFKEIIFTPIIVAYNESFVPIGKRCKNINTYAIIWHEGIAGRSKEDLISTFYAFFLANRDMKKITIWLDNCSSQNKNWTLISFFIYAANSLEIALEDLVIKYFEPGHTFMAADSFHHQVELSLKRKNKVYDFDDFSSAVKAANSSKVTVIEMQIGQFFKWMDHTSKYKLQRLATRVYLRDIVALSFKRGRKVFSFKTEFKNEFEEVKDIFNQKFLKGPLKRGEQCTICRGVNLERKTTLISKLTSHIPANRLKFWTDLPVSSNTEEEVVDD